ncbi:hypothetical protein ACXET9_02135 [Brachybacterium sp. DNPG3]
MADWKTYVKAAQNTARKQAPEVGRAAKESVEGAARRTGDYARAAGKAVEGARREEPRDERDRLDQQERRERADRDERDSGSKRSRFDAGELRKDAVAYAAVAGKHAKQANIGGTILKAIREALLIGGSLLAIWFVLSAAGVPIPFSAMIVFVAVIVVIALVGTLYANFKRRPAPGSDDADDEGSED